MANRAIDKLIAEIMDWSDIEVIDTGGIGILLMGSIRSNESGNMMRVLIPCYSTDIAAAWKVVEKLKLSVLTLGNSWIATRLPQDSTIDTYENGRGYIEAVTDVSAEAETAPMAICLAVLKAAGVEMPEGA